MNDIQLSLKPTSPKPVDHAIDAVDGWMIPGDQPERWAAEIAEWGIDLASATLHIIAAAKDPAGIEGVFVPCTENVTSARAIPYRKVGMKLFLPTHAEINPPVDSEELNERFSDEISAYVWHPGIGLVAFEPDQLVPLSELLYVPNVDEDRWNRAQVGVYLNTRLRSIGRPIADDPQDLMQTMGDGIGSKAPDLGQLDPTLTKSEKSFFSRMGQKIRSWFTPGSKNKQQEHSTQPATTTATNQPGGALTSTAGTILGFALFPVAWVASQLTSRVPATSDSRTWVNGIEDWANRLLQNSLNLFDARRREIQRLLNMLEMTPDEGLQYAIPLTGSASNQQTASPSANLGRRDVNFSLSGLSNSGGGDFWDLPPQVQLELTERYRRLAQREIELGRHKRAAYIYAELLGDMHLAAATLKQGEHYQEAAVLYEKKLNNLSEAATCYMKCGNFDQAIRIYEQLQAFEQIGDLCIKLDQVEDAHRWFRRAAEKERLQKNYLHVSRILEEKVGVPDEAIEFLRTSRPGGSIDQKLVSETFRLMGKYGQHQKAQTYAGEFRDVIGYAGSDARISKALLGVIESYPSDQVKQEALRSIQTLTSRSLKEQTASASGCLKVFAQTAPEDRLLSRDTKRYHKILKQHEKGRPQRETHSKQRKSVIDMVISEIELKLDPESLIDITSTAWGWYALFSQDSKLRLWNAPWTASPNRFFMKLGWPNVEADRFIFNPLLIDRLSIAIRPIQGPPLKEEPGGRFSESSEFAGTPGWISQDPIGIASLPSGNKHWVLEANGTLSIFRQDGTLLESFTILRELIESQIVEDSVTVPFPMVVSHREIYFAIGRTLVICDQTGHSTRTIEFDFPIRKLAVTRPAVRARLAVLFDEGGVVYWPDTGKSFSFSDDLFRPDARFLLDGRLLVSSDQFLQTYATQRDRLVRLAVTPVGKLDLQPPVKILQTNENDAVAFADAAGKISICRLKPKQTST